jgi:hypothetical protein
MMIRSNQVNTDQVFAVSRRQSLPRQRPGSGGRKQQAGDQIGTCQLDQRLTQEKADGSTELQAGQEASRSGSAQEAGRKGTESRSKEELRSRVPDSAVTLPQDHGVNSDSAVAIAATRSWLEKVVIGLQLCPFARAVYSAERIRYSVSSHASTKGLKEDLAAELQLLALADEIAHETTLLIHPHVLQSFADYNEFLSEADATVAELGYEGELQVASFHPLYQFQGTASNDVENFSNRSPYPMLHLLRESSIERAIETYPNVDDIPNNNIRTLRALGIVEMQKLLRQP